MSKKDFSNAGQSAASKFLSSAPSTNNEVAKKTPKKIQEKKEEKKSHKTSVLLKPSLHENLKKIAHMKQTSTNDLINKMIDSYVNENKEDVEQYNKIFSKN